MIRLLAFLVGSLLVVAAVVWIAERPGTLTVTWLGWQLETTVGIALVGLLVLVIGLMMLFRLAVRLLAIPGAIGGWREGRRLKRGYAALTRGMVAVAAGDPTDAAQQAKAAHALLKDDPLALLLMAEAAQLGGDLAAARDHFGRMLAAPETEFLGLRGLLMQALSRGDAAEALDLAARAVALRPQTAWAQKVLFDLQTRAGRWADALETLPPAARAGAFTAEAARRKRGLLLYMRGREAARDGAPEAARRWLREAVGLVPGLAGAAVQLARLYAQAGRARAGTKILERQWAVAPDAEVAEAYLALRAETPGLLGRKPQEGVGSRQKFADALAAYNPTASESLVLQADTALAAGDLARARRSLEAAEAREQPPTARLCRLAARLETAAGDPERARLWLERSAEAAAPAVYVCTSCGAIADRWTPVCTSCAAFDSLKRETHPPALDDGPRTAVPAVEVPAPPRAGTLPPGTPEPAAAAP